MNDSKYSLNDLEGRSYRDLQQLAKSLGLPSNVKKIYLIQLIYAKKFKTAVEVDNIVQRVKLERQRSSRVRKSTANRKRIYLQNTEISSTSNSLSPPIRATPKRPGHIIIQCDPDVRHTIMKYPRQSLLHSSFIKKTYPSPTKPSSSDRVLRSFSLKSQNSKLNTNSNILKVIKAQSSMDMKPAITQRSVSEPNQTTISLVSRDRSYPRINVTAKCVGKKHNTYVCHPRSRLATNETTGQMVSVQDKHVQTDSQCSTETDMPRIYDLFKATEDDMNTRRDYKNDCLEDFNTSTSSLERSTSSQQATIPEMVEDALEIISQDGDYMERIGMDVRMQCILCSWAGPRIILEYHIRKDHPNEIHMQDRSDWNVTFTLGSLVQDQLWQSRVVECNSILYVLSVKYEDPDYFMASLTMLSSESMPKAGTVTIYNKVTGKPYTWSGDIDLLPPSLPYYAEQICLKLQISCLDLLPNSANLELMNRELVIKSPSKVVVGQPDLNDIHVILFVNIFN